MDILAKLSTGELTGIIAGAFAVIMTLMGVTVKVSLKWLSSQFLKLNNAHDTVGVSIDSMGQSVRDIDDKIDNVNIRLEKVVNWDDWEKLKAGNEKDRATEIKLAVSEHENNHKHVKG